LVAKVALNERGDVEATFGGFLAVLRSGWVEPRYMLNLLRCQHARRQFINDANQTTNIANVSLRTLRPYPVAIPPLAEQQRIVAKVDELMALCDELETRQERRHTVRRATQRSALEALSAADSPDTLARAWDRVRANWEGLTSHPDSISPLRQAILQLAVQGRLVEQDPKDESGSKLLTRAAPGAGTKVTKERLSPSLESDATVLPPGWARSPLGRVTRICTGKLDVNAAVPDGEYPFFTCAKKVYKIDEYAHDTKAVILAGNGNFNVTWYSGRFNVYQRTYVIEPLLLDVRYTYLAIKERIPVITASERGSTIKYLRLGDIANCVIAIPPLAEQRRIVAKVDALMALCDQLEARLQSQETTSTRLAAAAVHTLAN